MISREPIFSIRCELANVLDLGPTPFGHRRVVNILGGRVTGAKLNGRVLPGVHRGADQRPEQAQPPREAFRRLFGDALSHQRAPGEGRRDRAERGVGVDRAEALQIADEHRFGAARRETGEDVSKLRYERFEELVLKQAEDIRKKTGCRRLVFEVQTQEGKVRLIGRPAPAKG